MPAFRLESQFEDLNFLRHEFLIPKDPSTNSEIIYFCGNSLGLQPKRLSKLLDEELLVWSQRAVEGHFDHPYNRPWAGIDQLCIQSMTRLTGALPHELSIMNSLSVNLHILLNTFYEPNQSKCKILIDNSSFPSDYFVVESHLKTHGKNPDECILELPKPPCAPEHENYNEIVLNFIKEHLNDIQLILLSGVQYVTGHLFDMAAISKVANENNIIFGLDLAHAIGNVPLKLHDWQVDFASWCSYKYLNAGPGGISGIFIHERHHESIESERKKVMHGWWGTDDKTRFQMSHTFKARKGPSCMAMSNPSVFAMISLYASMQVFDLISFDRLREKSLALLKYLRDQVESKDLLNRFGIVPLTPWKNHSSYGCQLSFQFTQQFNVKGIAESLREEGIIIDFRHPNVLRISPNPLYNTFVEVGKFVDVFENILNNKMKKETE